MSQFPKLLIILGAILIIIGLLWPIGGRYFQFLGKLPGDIAIDKGNFKFYFPVMTCIVLSIVLSLIAYMIRWFK